MRKSNKTRLLAVMLGTLLQVTVVCDVPQFDVVFDDDDDRHGHRYDCCYDDDDFFLDFWWF